MSNLPANTSVDQMALQLRGNPVLALEQYQVAAKGLWGFVDAGNAMCTLSGRKYLRVEGWQFLARAFGLSTRTKEVHKIPGEPETWQATVEVVDPAGVVVGQGVSLCDRSEAGKGRMPANALAAMAQTRATSRALRQVLSFVAVLAGVEPTPAEEMDYDRERPEVWEERPQRQPEPQDDVRDAEVLVDGQFAARGDKDGLVAYLKSLGLSKQHSQAREVAALYQSTVAQMETFHGDQHPAMPDAPEPITHPQLQALQAHYKAIGATREWRLDAVSDILGVRVESFSKLTKEQASAVLETINREEAA